MAGIPNSARGLPFLASSRPPHSLTCDRAAFLGRQSDPARPAGLVAWNLDGELEGVADPCAAFQVHIDLAAGATEEIVFVLGEGGDATEAGRLAVEWADVDRAKQALAENDAAWKQRLGAVKVSTPDPAFDLMVNRWLLNQSFASRIFARAGFQQAGGAFGFRDQLQDMMALLFTEPQRVRAHILDSASRQFEEGDVLHWWHPPLGRGVRTHCSDDLLWLVYATGRYVGATGDRSILAEEIPFLSAPPLGVGGGRPLCAVRARSGERHPVRTLPTGARSRRDRGGSTGCRLSAPGIGTTAWTALAAKAMAKACGWPGSPPSAPTSSPKCPALSTGATSAISGVPGPTSCASPRTSLAGTADGMHAPLPSDGLPWGSKESDECQIDSISQSWSALAGGPSPERKAMAIAAATERLVDPDARLVRLLTPPFEHTPRDPGYIRAYPPGVRENAAYNHSRSRWAWPIRLGTANSAIRYSIYKRRSPTLQDLRIQNSIRGEPYVLAAEWVRGAVTRNRQAGWTRYTVRRAAGGQLAVEASSDLTRQRCGQDQAMSAQALGKSGSPNQGPRRSPRHHHREPRWPRRRPHPAHGRRP